MDEAKQKLLREKFPPTAIGKLPKGGVMLDYVGHAAVTDRLLKIDPEWSWEPMALDPNGSPTLDADRNLWIRLTVCGVTRIGVGDGKTMKERIGDAIRNAAMRFGVALDLWSKEELESAADAEPPATPISDKTRRELFALFNEQGIPEDKQLDGINQLTGAGYTSRKELSEEHARQVIGWLRSRKVAA